MFEILSQLGKELNQGNILWGVGGSILLNHYGLVDNPGDIDIFVDIKDIEKATKVLDYMGKRKVCQRDASYSTKHFFKYAVDGIDVDIMGGFIINHCAGKYQYIIDRDAISQFKIINGVDIPLTALEDWYILYQLMPQRENKVSLIEGYLVEKGITRRDLLERALKEDLPSVVSSRVQKTLDL